MMHATEMHATDIVEATLRDVWNTIPADVTVAGAVAMPLSPMRNLTLRKALAIPFPSDALCQINQFGDIQIACRRKQRTQSLANILENDLPGWDVTIHRRDDGVWHILALNPAV